MDRSGRKFMASIRKLFYVLVIWLSHSITRHRTIFGQALNTIGDCQRPTENLFEYATFICSTTKKIKVT
jgi:hypothetical protein